MPSKALKPFVPGQHIIAIKSFTPSAGPQIKAGVRYQVFATTTNYTLKVQAIDSDQAKGYSFTDQTQAFATSPSQPLSEGQVLISDGSFESPRSEMTVKLILGDLVFTVCTAGPDKDVAEVFTAAELRARGYTPKALPQRMSLQAVTQALGLRRDGLEIV